MGNIEHSKIECDGGPYCQAPEHVHGCFAEGRTWLTGPKEVSRLRDQLAGAVQALLKIAHEYAGESSTMRATAWHALEAMGVDPSTAGGRCDAGSDSAAQSGHITPPRLRASTNREEN